MKENDAILSKIDFYKVGQKMRQLRCQNGITQEKVAKDLGCTISYVSNLENNRVNMNLRTLLYYSDLCHVSIDDILSAGYLLAPETDDHATKIHTLENLFKQFDNEQQDKIIKSLRLWLK